MDEQPKADQPGDEQLRAFVAELLRRKPRAQFSKVLAAWRVRRRQPTGAEEEGRLRLAYEQEWEARRGQPPPPAQEEQRRRAVDQGVLLGLGLALALHVLVLAIGSAFVGLSCSAPGLEDACEVASALGMQALFGIGVVQVLYLGPAAFIAYQSGRGGIAQGMIIGGALTLLLNAACYGLVFAFLGSMW